MALGLYQKAIHSVRYWLLRKLPPCKEVVPIMSESLERPLSLRERVKLKLHLWICIWCVWYLEHLHLMRKAVEMRAAKINEDEAVAAPALSTDARERLKRALSSKEN